MFQKSTRTVSELVLSQRRSEPCWVCGKRPTDASHIKTRGSGGPDTLWNVVAKCREHHIEWGQIGPIKFISKYPIFAYRIKALGWVVENGKLTNPSLHHPLA